MNKQSLLAALAAVGLAAGAGAQSVDTVIATNLLYEPMGAVVNGDNFYITASASNRVMIYNQATGLMNILAGSGAGAQGIANSTNGLLARFYSPQGIVLAPVWLAPAGGFTSTCRRAPRAFRGSSTETCAEICGPPSAVRRADSGTET